MAYRPPFSPPYPPQMPPPPGEFWNQFYALGHQPPPPPPLFPPLPGNNGYAIAPPHTYPNTFMPVQQAAHAVPGSAAAGFQPLPKPVATNNRIMEISEADKEEGELTEGDRVSQSPANRAALLRAVQKQPAPSVHSTAKGQVLPAQRNDSSSSRPQSSPAIILKHTATKSSNLSTEPLAKTPASADEVREQAEKTIRLFHEYGYGFEELVRMTDLDPEILRKFCNELGLPLPALKHTVPAKVTTVAPLSQLAVKPAVSIPPKVTASQPAAKMATSLPPKPVMVASPVSNQNAPGTSAPSLQDRKEYLARLKAARSSKTATLPIGTQVQAPARPAIDAPTVEGTQKPSVLDKITPKASLPTTTARSTTNGTRSGRTPDESKTELVRKKLAALHKASPSAKVAHHPVAVASSDATPAPPSRSSSLSSAIYASGQEQQQVSASALPFSGRSSASAAAPAEMGSIPSSISQRRPQLTSQSSWLSASEKIPGLDLVGSSHQSHVQPSPSTPFGQSSTHVKEKFVIDLSEDEDDDMDIDDTCEVNAGLPLGKIADQPPTKDVVKKLFPVTKVPSPAATTKVAISGIGKTPLIHTPGSQSSNEALERKEKEIAALHKHIEEIEKRRKATFKSKHPGKSQPATPAAVLSATASTFLPRVSTPTSGMTFTPSPMANASKSINPAASAMKPSNLEQDPSAQSPAPRSKDWKKTRQAEIQSDLPLLEAKLASNKAKVEELRKQMELIEAENAQSLEVQANLVRELESLGIDTEGMPQEEMQAMKDAIVLQREMATAVSKDYPASPAPSSALDSGQVPMTEETANEPETVENGILVVDQGTTPDQRLASITNEDMVLDEPTAHAKAVEAQLPTTLASLDQASTSNPEQDMTVQELAERSAQIEGSTDSGDQAFASHNNTSAQDEHSRAAMARHEISLNTDHVESDVSDDMEISEDDSEDEQKEEHGGVLVAPVAPLAPGLVSSTSSKVLIVPEEAEDGEDFYSPESAAEDPIEGFPSAQTEGRTENEDIIMGGQDISAEDGASHHTQAEDPARTLLEDGDIEMAESLNAGQDYEPQAISQHILARDEQSIPIADDLVPELQPLEQPSTRATKSASVSNHVATPLADYESPLRYFKSYRNHPDYTKNVKGGYRSMTYSHQIDPMKELCRWEWQPDGKCNDNTCVYQHYRDMELSADMVLVQLGTANPGNTETEKQQFKEGLKSIIKDLRLHHTNDPEIIATRFSEYRRKFLNDDTRVLNL